MTTKQKASRKLNSTFATEEWLDDQITTNNFVKYIKKNTKKFDITLNSNASQWTINHQLDKMNELYIFGKMKKGEFLPDSLRTKTFKPTYEQFLQKGFITETKEGSAKWITLSKDLIDKIDYKEKQLGSYRKFLNL